MRVRKSWRTMPTKAAPASYSVSYGGRYGIKLRR